VKNCNNGQSRRRDFSDYCPAEKACIFLAVRYCEKCMGKSNAGKEKQKKVNAKINANNLCQRKLF
jgi:hypothetical protein